MIMVMPLSVQLLSSVDDNDDNVMMIKIILVMTVLTNIMFYKYPCRYPVALDDNDYNDNHVESHDGDDNNGGDDNTPLFSSITAFQ